jgi:nitrous oxidase accessory protein NosD
LNEDVSVTFTQLPSESQSLRIEKVFLTNEEIEKTNSVSNIAFDISTDMVNGSFEYDLTLPFQYGDDVTVGFTDNRDGLENGINELESFFENGVLNVKGLDHFTVFVVVETIPAGITEGVDKVNEDCSAVLVDSNRYCYDTIQEAINAATGGETIYVGDGTYEGPFVIDKPNLTLQSINGANLTELTYDKNDYFSWSHDWWWRSNTVTILSAGSGLTLSGFTIKNNSPYQWPIGEYTQIGIRLRNGVSNVLIENNIIEDVNYGVFLNDNEQNNVSINNITIRNNVISKVRKGIDITFGQNITIEGNTITGGSASDIHKAHAGIIVRHGNRDVLINNNTITNFGPGSFGALDIGTDNNDFPKSPANNISNLTITNNNLVGNTYGLLIGNWGPAHSQTIVPISGLKVEHNTITGNSYGIFLNSGAKDLLSLNNGVVIQRNSIYDNTFGVYASGDTAFANLTLNWWGDNSGPYDDIWEDASKPTTNPHGNGNAVYGPVDYRNWIGSEDFQINVDVNETEVEGVYYIQSGTDKYLSFSITSDSPIYGQVIRAGLWTYDSNTGSRTNPRYIGWIDYNANGLIVNEHLTWEMVSTNWIGNNPPGTQIPEGEYLLWVERYWDGGGYVSGSTITKRIVVDNTRPYGQILTPETGTFTNSNTVTVTGTAFDSISGVGRVDVRLRNYPNNTYRTTWIVADLDEFGNFSVEVDVSTSPDDVYEIAVVVYDNAGNNRCLCPRPIITLDRETPTSTLSILADHHEAKNRTLNNSWKGLQWFKEYTQVIIDLQGENNDFVNYAFIGENDECTEATYFTYIENLKDELNSKDNGTYKLCFYAEDLAGNTEDPINEQVLKIDTTRGTSEIVSMSGNYVDGIYYTQSPVSIEAELKDNESGIARTRLYINDKSDASTNVKSIIDDTLVEAGVTHTHYSTFNDLPDGEYYVRVMGYDRAQNHTNTARADFVVDNTDPQGSIDYLYYSSRGMYVEHFITNDNTPILGGSCFDENLDTIILEVNGSTQDLLCNNGTWLSDFVSVSGLSDGTYTAKLTLVDLAGNATVVTQNITIDTVAPTAVHTYYRNGVEITGPIAFVKGVDELTFTGVYEDADPSSGLHKDVFVVFRNSDLKAYCSWNQVLTGGVSLNSTGYQDLSEHQNISDCVASLEDGEYHIRHRIYDNATRSTAPTFNQHRQYTRLQFVVDSVAPVSEITSPSTGLITNEDLEILGTTTDNFSVSEVILSYAEYDGELCGDFEEFARKTSSTPFASPFNWSHTWTPDTNGIYCMKAQGVDLAGNIESTSIVENIIFDTADPTISNVSISNGTLSFNYDGGISGVESIEIKINDGAYQPYITGMNLHALVNNVPGTYTVYIKVTDRAGNEKIQTSSFTIPVPATTAVITSPGVVLGTTEPATETTTTTATVRAQNIVNTQRATTSQTTLTEEDTFATEMQDEKEIDGEILGEKESNEEEENKDSNDQKSFWRTIWPWLIAIVLVGFPVLYFISKRKKY